MDNTAASDHAVTGGLPERLVTPNQVAAYNMARWRKAAGMTQAQLGAELGGWTKGAVSTAERSWDEGSRTREFDAELIADLASIFHVPVGAFFVPPPDDGEAVTYLVNAGGDQVTMGQFFALLWPEPDWDADTPAAVAYQKAVTGAMAKYGGPEAAAALIADAVADQAAGEEVNAALGRARENGRALAELHTVFNRVNGGALAGVHSLFDALAEENAMLQAVLERALAGRQEEQ